MICYLDLGDNENNNDDDIKNGLSPRANNSAQLLQVVCQLNALLQPVFETNENNENNNDDDIKDDGFHPEQTIVASLHL